ncbi:hypothetical protein NMY22_g13198 [Coprinellus aureogranulatus]|nr:hypothetical protein NMY22_g13198 [Coprinellus aureogranulatus]
MSERSQSPMASPSDPPSTSASTSQPKRTLTRPRRPTARAIAGRRQNAARGRKRRCTQASSEGEAAASSDDDDDDASNTQAPAAQPSRSTEGLTGVALKKALFDERFNVKLMMEGWTSSVYDHFILPPAIIEETGKDVRHRFTCKKYPSTQVTRVYYNESTSNLNRHGNSCDAEDTAESRALVAYVKGSSYNPARHRLRIVLWVARRSRAYSIIEDEELQDIFRDLHANCESPSRHTLSRDVIKVHGLTKEAVVEMLVTIDSSIHVAADGWTSPNTIAYIGVTIHYVEKGAMVTLVLDFVRLTKAHTGEYLASKLAECLQDFKIDDRVLGFTGDNASNNDTLVSELEVLLPAFRGDVHRVRCACHILNLVAKAILSAFAQKVSKEDLDTQAALNELEDEMTEQEYQVPEPEGDRLAPEVVAADASAVDEVIASIQQELDEAAEADLEGRVPSLSATDASVARLALTKLRKLAIKISNSPLLRESLYEWCDRVKIARHLLQKDVSTRWNSTAELSVSGRHLRPALDRMVVQSEFNKSTGVRLRRFKPTDTEWKVLEQLTPLLNNITYATKELSRSAKPLVHEVIPIMDTLTAVFDEVIDDTSLHPVVRHAALRGARMLNKYYSKTDDSIVYRIAMILHPHYKMDYFTKAGWEAAWIAEARRIITHEWTTRYKPVSVVPASTSQALSSSLGTTTDRFAGIRERFNFHRNASSSSVTADPLEEWLATPPIATNVKLDPIKYWSDMKAGGHPLAQMALDYLSVPATSTDVERAFSKGGLTVSKLRHSLSDASTRAQTVLGEWTKVPGLVPFEKIVKVFKDKLKRSKRPREEDAGDVIDVDKA